MKSPKLTKSQAKKMLLGEEWQHVIKEIVSVLCYQPEIPHQHKIDLCEALNKALPLLHLPTERKSKKEKR